MNQHSTAKARIPTEKINWRDYLRDREQVSLKKYLYVFRPLLASYGSATEDMQPSQFDIVARPRCLPQRLAVPIQCALGSFRSRPDI